MGEPFNPKYILAASYSDMITYTYAAEATGAERYPSPSTWTTVSNPDGTKWAGGTFDMLVPGLLVLVADDAHIHGRCLRSSAKRTRARSSG